MVHGKSVEQTDEAIKRMKDEATAITGQSISYDALSTLREYKKTSMRYFTE